MKELTVPSHWELMKEQASVFIKSGFLPPSINTPEKAIAIAMTGKELGLSFMESVRSINIIAGKPTISPQLMLALANKSKELENLEIDANDQRCVVTVTRKGRKPHREEFGIKEATDLLLISKDNYKKQPATMFKWRALAAALRVTFPDVMLGFYTPEEMGAEVKVGEDEQMEVTSLPEGDEVDIGKIVPKAYWDLRNTDPEAAQALLGGPEYYAKKNPDPAKNPKGLWTIHTRDKAEEFAKPGPLEPQKIEDKSPQNDEKLSGDEQATLLALMNEKGVDLADFKKFVKEEVKAKGWNSLKHSQYPRLYEWVIRNAKEPVK